jgi:hypothetical protein
MFSAQGPFTNHGNFWKSEEPERSSKVLKELGYKIVSSSARCNCGCGRMNSCLSNSVGCKCKRNFVNIITNLASQSPFYTEEDIKRFRGRDNMLDMELLAFYAKHIKRRIVVFTSQGAKRIYNEEQTSGDSVALFFHGLHFDKVEKINSFSVDENKEDRLLALKLQEAEKRRVREEAKNRLLAIEFQEAEKRRVREEAKEFEDFLKSFVVVDSVDEVDDWSVDEVGDWLVVSC